MIIHKLLYKKDKVETFKRKEIEYLTCEVDSGLNVQLLLHSSSNEFFSTLWEEYDINLQAII